MKKLKFHCKLKLTSRKLKITVLWQYYKHQVLLVKCHSIRNSNWLMSAYCLGPQVYIYLILLLIIGYSERWQLWHHSNYYRYHESLAIKKSFFLSKWVICQTSALLVALTKTIFSAEAHIWMNRYVKKHIFWTWDDFNPLEIQEHPNCPEKVAVWCGFSVGRR